MTPVLFDMDGILLEGARTDPQVYANAADEAIADLAIDPTPEQRRDLRGTDLEVIVTRCLELDVDPGTFWARKERFASAGTHERIRTGDRGSYDDADAVTDLAERTTIALVTNNRHETARFVSDYCSFKFGLASPYQEEQGRGNGV